MSRSWMFVWFVACSGATTTPKHTDETDADTDADSDTDTDADTDTDTATFVVPHPVAGTLEAECPMESRYGTFSVDVYSDYSLVAGSVADSVNPVTILELMDEEGDCKLLRRNNPFCDPPCSAGDVCDFDGSCIPFPVNQDVGRVTVGGLEQDVIMNPVEPGRQYFETDVPHPVFTPGALLELRTWSTTFGSDVVLHGYGVEPISLGRDDTWIIYDGQDLPITWNAEGDSNQSRVSVRLNIDQHGTTPVTMVCDLPDTGSAALPERLVSTLINYGVTGFPNATLARRTVDSAPMADGCVQFVVQSPTVPQVRVDGFIPCAGPPDCPGGQICDPVTFICHP